MLTWTVSVGDFIGIRLLRLSQDRHHLTISSMNFPESTSLTDGLAAMTSSNLTASPLSSLILQLLSL